MDECPGGGCGVWFTFHHCKVHGYAKDGCSCQDGPFTPLWYISVKTCERHKHLYDPSLAPDWWNIETNDLKANDRFHGEERRHGT